MPNPKNSLPISFDKTPDQPNYFVPAKSKRKGQVVKPAHRPPKLTHDFAMKFVKDLYQYYQDTPRASTLVHGCAHLGHSKAIISDLSDRYPDFSDHISRLKTLLEARTIDKGETARNPIFSIFMLKSVYDYKDRVDLNVSGEVTVQHVTAINSAWMQRMHNKPQTAIEDAEVLPDNVDK